MLRIATFPCEICAAVGDPVLQYHMPEVAVATVEEVLAALDRWRDRNDGHHTEKRAAIRFAYRESIEIVVETPTARQRVTFSAFARDISVTGMSFIVTGFLEPTARGEETRALSAATVLQRGRRLQVILPRATGAPLRLIAEVVRLRRVQNGLSECGVRFLERCGEAEGDSHLRDPKAACGHNA